MDVFSKTNFQQMPYILNSVYKMQIVFTHVAVNSSKVIRKMCSYRKVKRLYARTENKFPDLSTSPFQLSSLLAGGSSAINFVNGAFTERKNKSRSPSESERESFHCQPMAFWIRNITQIAECSVKSPILLWAI